jgi:WD40 repeat protein
VAVSNSNSPFINAYAWTSGSGFGTKFANPATLPAGGPQSGTPKSIAFSPAGDAVAIAHTTTPFVTVYPWSGSGFGTKFANPATLPVSNGFGVAFSPAGDAIAVINGGSPAITVYPWSGAGFGTKYANPGTLPTAAVSLVFSPNGDTLAIADAGSPFIRAYPWNSATGFGTIYPNPATLPTAASNDISSTYNF